VRPGDKIEVTLRHEESQPLGRERLLHLDAFLLAVDKPAGVSAQDDLAGGPALPDLCSALLSTLGERETQALLVHRLDRGTTGVTVLARTRRAQAALLEEFREHRAAKEYRALVAGAPGNDSGVIDLALGPAERGLRQPDLGGESARTNWRVLLQTLGCPILGDHRYGGPSFVARQNGSRLDFARPLLHALSLSLRHPGGTRLNLTAPTPADFEAARAFLSGSR